MVAGLQRCTELGCAPVCAGQKAGGRNGSVGVGWGLGGVVLAKKGAGNTRKSGFYIERGRDGVRMG